MKNTIAFAVVCALTSTAFANTPVVIEETLEQPLVTEQHEEEASESMMLACACSCQEKKEYAQDEKVEEKAAEPQKAAHQKVAMVEPQDLEDVSEESAEPLSEEEDVLFKVALNEEEDAYVQGEDTDAEDELLHPVLAPTPAVYTCKLKLALADEDNAEKTLSLEEPLAKETEDDSSIVIS